MSGDPSVNISTDRLCHWLSTLVCIPSVTPTQAPSQPEIAGEGRIAKQVARWFEQFGGEVHVDEVLPDRPNVYGLWRGGGERWLALDVHVDTVGINQMTGDPFDGRVKDGKLFGRGSVDTKASLAVMLAVLEHLHGAGRKPAANLLVAATVDEEASAKGAPAMARWLRDRGLTIDEMLVAEPTDCAPVHGHKGVLRLDCEVAGKATHSSQPQLGKNAVTAAAQLALAFDQEHQRLAEADAGCPLGRATLTVTQIAGGRAASVVPDACTVTVDYRVLSTQTVADVTTQLTAFAQAACPLPVSVAQTLAIEAFYQSPDSSLVRKLAQWSNQPARTVPYCTNAWAYGDVARQRVVIGPGSIDQAHGAQEWVQVEQLARLAQVYGRWVGRG